MAELVLHARAIETVFDLLGREENDMTAALGWALSRSPALLGRFVGQVVPHAGELGEVVLELQRHDAADGGYTDIELRSSDVHVIVEAKRGWALPSRGQLRRYEARFASLPAAHQAFVVLTQNGVGAIVRNRLSGWSPPDPIVVVVLGWSELVRQALEASRHRGPVERHVAGELATYLRGVADMRDTNTNSVHVVSLRREPWAGWPANLSPVDEVEQHRVYHYPTTGGNYPKIVPNYMGFRYDGKLQSIHHVDDYAIVESPFGLFPGAPDLRWDEPAYLLRLGPPFRPNHEVRTGPGIFRAAPVTADLDLLLTCSTVPRRARRRRLGVGALFANSAPRCAHRVATGAQPPRRMLPPQQLAARRAGRAF
jgi:hypothetical protein